MFAPVFPLGLRIMEKDSRLKSLAFIAAFLLSIVAFPKGTLANETSIKEELPGLQTLPMQFWLEVSDSPLKWSEAMEHAQWTVLDREFNEGYDQNKVWIKQDLLVDRQGHWVFQIAYPLLDYVDIYILHQNQVVKQVFTGDARLFYSRERGVNDFVVAFEPDQTGEYQLLIRAETEGTLMLPSTWWDENEYENSLLTQQMLFGGFYAVLLAMAIYNLFIYITIRERTYLYYVLSVVTLMGIQMGFDGRGFAWFWPNLPHVNSWYFPVAYSLYQIASITFMDSFLKLKRYSPLLYKYFYGLKTLASINLILVLFLPYETITPIVVFTGIAVVISGLLSGALLWYRGFVAARYFTLAWGLFLCGMILVNFRGLGVFESTILSQYAYIFGSLMEVLLLSFSLADRISSSQRAKRKTERALLEEQNKHLTTLKRYQDLYENAPVGNFQSDMNHSLINVNRTCAQIFGFDSRDEMVRKVADIREYLLSPYLEYKNLIREVMTTQQITNHELKIKNNKGDEIWISVAMRLTDLDGVRRFEGSIVNISKRKNAELEQRKLETERLQVMEQFAVGIAKEINTPLGSNAATTAFVKETLEDVKEATFAEGDQDLEERVKQLEGFISLSSQSLELIQENQRRIIRVVKRFREVSAQHFGMQLNMFRLKDILVESVDNRRWNMAGWRVKVNCSEEIVLHSYSRAIFLIIDQLLENSSVHAYYEQDEPQVVINVQQEGAFVIVEYWDNGEGVKPELLDKLVQPFFTTKRGPMGHIGLGLYMVYNLVNRILMGRVSVENRPEAGLEIKIQIPLKAVDQQSK